MPLSDKTRAMLAKIDPEDFPEVLEILAETAELEGAEQGRAGRNPDTDLAAVAEILDRAADELEAL